MVKRIVWAALLSAWLFLWINVSAAAVFQYTVPVATEKGTSAAFLWLPPQAKQVRGVVVSGMTLMEREFVKDPRIREACARQQLALVFLKTGLLAADTQKVLDDLAQVSGYRELSVAPLMFVGHSAGGPQAKELAVKFAARCFGLVQYRGGGPFDGEPLPPTIPSLMMVGQFDEFHGTMRDAEGREAWERGRDALANFRAADPQRLASIVVEPGAGHFAWSQRNADYLALFIGKAARACIPEWPGGVAKPVALREVSPQSGWLSDMTISTKGSAPALYEDYKGDKAKANWHFDREMAEATVAYHTGIVGKKDQFIKWNDAFWVDAGVRYFFTQLKWVGDGQTFETHPFYADAYPSPAPNGGPRWSQAGQPVGHSGAPILVRQVSGPVVSTGPNTLRMQYDALAPATEGSRVTFMAFSEGDAEYRYTETIGMMPRGFAGLTNGKEQTITFAPIGNPKPNSGPVALKATSDAGLPVEFYVAHGPAIIEGSQLRISEIPDRANFPLPVKIVAYQFGSGVAPLIKTAKPVEQTILIEKP